MIMKLRFISESARGDSTTSESLPPSVGWHFRHFLLRPAILLIYRKQSCRRFWHRAGNIRREYSCRLLHVIQPDQSCREASDFERLPLLLRGWQLHRESPSSEITFSRNVILLFRESRSVSFISGHAILSGIPGKPAPVPTSIIEMDESGRLLQESTYCNQR